VSQSPLRSHLYQGSGAYDLSPHPPLLWPSAGPHGPGDRRGNLRGRPASDVPGTSFIRICIHPMPKDLARPLPWPCAEGFAHKGCEGGSEPVKEPKPLQEPAS